MVVFDTGHNISGIRRVLEQVESTRFSKLHFVYGCVNDKEVDQILRILPKEARYYFTQASIPRAMEVKLLAAKAAFYDLKGTIHVTVSEAIQAAKKSAAKEDLILVGGSTFVVADGLPGAD